MFTEFEKKFLIGLIDFFIKSLRSERDHYTFYSSICDSFDSTICEIEVLKSKIEKL